MPSSLLSAVYTRVGGRHFAHRPALTEAFAEEGPDSFRCSAAEACRG